MPDTDELRRAETMAFCVDANLVGEPVEARSPSGRYALTVRTYRTLPNRWNYSRGTVVRIADGAVVCDLARNLAQFHHSFVVKAGREFLIAGRSYMSQTIVDLDRGSEYEPAGPQYAGGAFCWATCYLSPDGNTLAVDGCVWACPYEVRFFDFRDPAAGWPALPIVGAECVDEPSDVRAPRWLDATTCDCHQRDADGEPHERTRLARRGDEMVVVERWLSDAERARRDAEARADLEHDAWWASFRATDPMYLRLAAAVREHAIPGDTLDGQPSARRVVQRFRRASPRASADLDWNVDARTIAVQLYGGAGERAATLAFAGTIDGLEAAIAAIAGAFRGNDAP